MKRLSYDSLALAMGRLLARRRAEDLVRTDPDVIVPIPMHWRRRLLRGVNDTEILAHALGRWLRLPVEGRWLVRRRSTSLQRDLGIQERFANVRGAFAVRSRVSPRHQGSHVLLVDDILTTGATCSEAARVLKEAGAAGVSVAVVARVANSQGG